MYDQIQIYANTNMGLKKVSNTNTIYLIKVSNTNTSPNIAFQIQMHFVTRGIYEQFKYLHAFDNIYKYDQQDKTFNNKRPVGLDSSAV